MFESHGFSIAMMLRLCGALAVLSLMAAPAVADSARGASLYENHCQACHSSRVHDRAQRLPANLAELRAQVERWQQQQNLRWREDDIADVVEYLNVTKYKF